MKISIIPGNKKLSRVAGELILALRKMMIVRKCIIKIFRGGEEEVVDGEGVAVKDA